MIQVENASGVVQQIDRSQAITTTPKYDHLGQRIEQTVSAGTGAAALSVTTKSVYDSQGRVTGEMDALGLTKNLEYDGQGRLTAVILPAVPNPQNPGTTARPRYEYGYDAQGNQTLIRDPLGRETRFSFDVNGRQLSRTLPLGVGQVLNGSLSDPRTAAGQAGAFTEGFFYDVQGRQSYHVSFEGTVTQFVYDDPVASTSQPVTGRLVEKRFFSNLADFNSGAGTPVETQKFSFDAFGRQTETRWTRSDGAVDVFGNAYNDRGELIRVMSPQGVVNYEYDNLGRKTRMFTSVTTSGAVNVTNDTRYEYDALGRLAKVSAVERNDAAVTPVENTIYKFDLAGNLDLQTTPDGVVTDMVYDALFRLDKLTDYGPDNTPSDLSNNPKRAEYDYTVRADGKRTAAVETTWFNNQPQTSTIGWTYDHAGRLTEEIFNHFDDARDQTERFAYDLVGNRVLVTKDVGNDGLIDEAIASLYDANDRIQSESKDVANDGTVDETTTYGWHATQQSSKAIASTTASSSVLLQTSSFQYDLQGRMNAVVSETFTSGTLTSRQRVTYDYDATGMRIASQHEVDADANGSFESSAPTEFLFEHSNFTGYEQAIKETTFGSTGITKTIEYTFGLDEIAQTVTEFNATGQATSTATHLFGHDGHGSVRVLLDAAAAIVQALTYEAYGDLLSIHNNVGQFVSASPADAISSLQYSGETFDVHTNWQYLRRRWMQDGRFNRLDPFAGDPNNPQSFHKYGYVHGDPIQGVDPTGQFFTLIGLLGGFGISRYSQSTYNGAVIGGSLGILSDVAALTWRLAFVGQSDLSLNYGSQNGPLHHSKNTIDISFPSGTDLAEKMDEIYTDLREFHHFNGRHNDVAKIRFENRNGIRYGFFDSLGIFGVLSDFINPIDIPVRVSSDISDRTVVADTLGWHMLVGQRRWTVRQVNGSTVQVATETYDWQRDWLNRIGVTMIGAQKQDEVWAFYLRNIRDHYVAKYGATAGVETFFSQSLGAQSTPWLPRDPYPGIEVQ